MRLRNLLVPIVLACCSGACRLPAAHAGTWTGPTYTVGNRIPSDPAKGGNDTTHPQGGGSGVDPTIGIAANGGPEAQGKVTATFTWVAAQGKDFTTDPPPAKLTILEEGTAIWQAGQIVVGGGGADDIVNGGQEGGNSVVGDNGEDAASARAFASSGAGLLRVGWQPHLTGRQSHLWPQGRQLQRGKNPRIIQVQAANPGGNAEDGLGDPQVLQANGQSGTSSGKWLHTYTVANGIVTTEQRTLHATVNTQGSTSWIYSAQIVPFKITCNGQDITDPQPAYAAEAGQNTALAFVGPGDFTITNPSWALPDKYVKDWVHSDTSASVVSVTPQELLSTSIPRLFWVSGGNKAVTFSATLNGIAVKLRGNISVHRPVHELSVRPDGVVNLDVDANREGLLGLGVPNVNTGVGSGVIFDVTNKPVPPATNNILKLAQVITGTTRWIIDGNNVKHTWTPTSGLDAFFAPGADSPNQGVSVTDKEIFMSDSFDTWLMYYPSSITGGNEHEDWIYVPLRKVSWSWSGHAIRHGATGWVAATDLVSATNAQAADGVDTFDHPTWTQKASQPEGDFDPKR